MPVMTRAGTSNSPITSTELKHRDNFRSTPRASPINAPRVSPNKSPRKLAAAEVAAFQAKSSLAEVTNEEEDVFDKKPTYGFILLLSPFLIIVGLFTLASSQLQLKSINAILFAVFGLLIPGILMLGYGISYKSPKKVNFTATEDKTNDVRKRDEFEWTYTEEPHATRREAILAAHPEIKSLFGPHWVSKYICGLTVVVQVYLSYWASLSTTTWWQFLIVGYVIGGTIASSLTLAIHECSHHLFFKSVTANMWFSLFANGPLVIPYSTFFKRYHMDHHRFQGIEVIDTDIPSDLEGIFFTTPLRKFFWVLMQPIFYAVRPKIINPKAYMSKDFLNMLVVILFNAPIIYYFGCWATYYLVFSTWMGLGMHPLASHFIAEHYTTISSKRLPHHTGLSPIKAGGEKRGEKLYPDETFSYRGKLNAVAYNVGYHMAHHDFPFVSGWRLPEVERLAPEFYDHLPSTDWWTVTYNYIMSSSTPCDRVKRLHVDKQ